MLAALDIACPAIDSEKDVAPMLLNHLDAVSMQPVAPQFFHRTALNFDERPHMPLRMRPHMQKTTSSSSSLAMHHRTVFKRRGSSSSSSHTPLLCQAATAPSSSCKPKPSHHAVQRPDVPSPYHHAGAALSARCGRREPAARVVHLQVEGRKGAS